MQNINAYPREQFEIEFRQTGLYQRLQRDFDTLLFEKHVNQLNKTPREIMGHRLSKTMFSLSPFYYLNFLLEKKPSEIYDLGCGWNIFKKYIPSIIGVGPENPAEDTFYADIHDFVDDNYIIGHQQIFQSVFSINALHYKPIENFGKVVADFYSMISPGGRGFLSLNLSRMIEFSKIFNKKTPPDQIGNFCRRELNDLDDIHWLVIDIDTQVLESMDGNVRLVMEREI